LINIAVGVDASDIVESPTTIVPPGVRVSPPIMNSGPPLAAWNVVPRTLRIGPAAGVATAGAGVNVIPLTIRDVEGESEMVCPLTKISDPPGDKVWPRTSIAPSGFAVKVCVPMTTGGGVVAGPLGAVT
jgi:hypothetical protein